MDAEESLLDAEELDREKIAEAFWAKKHREGWSKEHIARVSGVSRRTLDNIGNADPSVKIETLTLVSRGMWGDQYHRALYRAGRGQPPVEEEPNLADRIARVEAVQARLADEVRQLAASQRESQHLLEQLVRQLIGQPTLHQGDVQLREEDA